MKRLIKTTASALCLSVFLCGAMAASVAKADMVTRVQHLGDADPTGEGFANDGAAGTAVDDEGTAAWNINAGWSRYRTSLDESVTNEMYSDQWTANMTVRDLLLDDVATDWGVYMEVSDRTHTYAILVGSDSEGNPTLYYQMNWSLELAEIPLTGVSGSGYHNYQIVSGPSYTAGTADVLVDNILQATITGAPNFSVPGAQARFVFGGTDGTATCNANYSLVNLKTVPAVAPLPLPKHVGSTNPTTERFVNDGVAGSAVNDGGTTAWNINDPISRYRALLTSDELDNMASQGWTATMNVHNLLTGDTGTDWGIHLEASDRTHTYLILVGSDEVGDPTLYYLTSASAFTMEEIPLTGISGNGYHTYQMSYDPDNPGMVDVLVDNLYQGSIAGADNTVETAWAKRFCFGSTDTPAVSDANYSLVELAYGNIEVPKMPGDANRDGKVDATDAQALAENWLKTGGATWAQGDFNKDGNVDDIDATMMAANWGYGTTKSASVPEPGTIVLILGGALGLLVGRRRR